MDCGAADQAPLQLHPGCGLVCPSPMTGLEQEKHVFMHFGESLACCRTVKNGLCDRPVSFRVFASSWKTVSFLLVFFITCNQLMSG